MDLGSLDFKISADTKDLENELKAVTNALKGLSGDLTDAATDMTSTVSQASNTAAKEATQAAQTAQAATAKMVNDIDAKIATAMGSVGNAATDMSVAMNKTHAGMVKNFEDLTVSAKNTGSQMRNESTETMTSVQEDLSKLNQSFNQIKGLAGSMFLGISAQGLLSKIYDTRSYFQDAESSMKVFLGDAEKGTEFIKELKDYAFYNMFEFKDLVGASKQLISYGTAAEDVTGILDKLSNIATGTGASLNEMVSMYNKAKSVGKVDSNGLEAWAARGVLVKDTLKEMGEVIDGNSVSFKQLDMALNKVTGEGGMFHDLMKEQLNNLSASYAQLQDNLTSMFEELGESSEGVMKGAIDVAGSLVENWKEVGKAILDVTAVYGVYKAATMVDNYMEKSAQAERYKNEYDALSKLIEKKKENKNADLDEKVAKKQLTKEQAEQLKQIRAEVEERQKALTAIKEKAKEEHKAIREALQLTEQKIALLREEVAEAEKAADVQRQNTAVLALAQAEQERMELSKKKQITLQNALNASRDEHVFAMQREQAQEKANAKTSSLLTRVRKSAGAALKDIGANIAGMINPAGLAAAAVGFLAEQIIQAAMADNEREKAQKRLNAVQDEYQAKANVEIQKLAELKTTLEKTAEGTETYLQAKKDLLAISDKYNIATTETINGIESEINALDLVTRKYDEYKQAITKAYKEKGYQAFIEKEKEGLLEDVNEVTSNIREYLSDVLMKDGTAEEKGVMSARIAAAVAEISEKLMEGTISADFNDGMYKITGLSDDTKQIFAEFQKNMGWWKEGVTNLSTSWETFLDAISGDGTWAEANTDNRLGKEVLGLKLNRAIQKTKVRQESIRASKKAFGIEDEPQAVATDEVEKAYDWTGYKELVKKIESLEKNKSTLMEKLKKQSSSDGETAQKLKEDIDKVDTQIKAAEQLFEKQFGEKYTHEKKTNASSLRASQKEKAQKEKEQAKLLAEAKKDRETAEKIKEKSIADGNKAELELENDGFKKSLAQLKLQRDEKLKQIKENEKKYTAAMIDAAKKESLAHTGKEITDEEAKSTFKPPEMFQKETDATNQQYLKDTTDLLQQSTMQWVGYYKEKLRIAQEYSDKIEAIDNDTILGDAQKANKKSIAESEMQTQLDTLNNATANEFLAGDANFNSWVDNIQTESLEVLYAALEDIDRQLQAIGTDSVAWQANGAELSRLTAMSEVLKAQIQDITTKNEKNKEKQRKQLSQMQKSWSKFAQSVTKTTDTIRSFDSALSDTIADSVDLAVTIGDTAFSVINGITTLTDTSVKGMKTASTTAMTAIKAVETASVILEVISAVIQAAMAIANMFDGGREKRNAAIEAEIQSLNNLARLWKDAAAEKEKYYEKGGYNIEQAKANYQEEVKMIDKSTAAYRQAAKDRFGYRAKRSHSIWWYAWHGENGQEDWSDIAKETNKVFGTQIKGMEDFADLSVEQLKYVRDNNKVAWSKLDDEVRGYFDNIIDSESDAAQALEKFNDAILGVTWDSFRQNGLDALLDIDATAEDVYKNIMEYGRKAMIQKMFNETLQKDYDAFYKKYENYMLSGGGLDEEEIKSLKESAHKLSEKAVSNAQDINKIFEDEESLSETKTLSGAIQSASQESIDLLAGQTNAVRVNQISMMDIMREQLVSVVAIKKSTDRCVSFLSTIAKAVKDDNTNLRAEGYL